MGYIKHNAIVVTSWDDEELEKIHNKAKEIFNEQLVSELVKGVINGQCSFFIAPDGSKEGWETSQECDVMRETFTEWLRTEGRMNDYVEVRFGGDDGQAYIIG